MKRTLIAFLVGLGLLVPSTTSWAQDEVPNNIIYGALVGIEEMPSDGLVSAVFRGGRTVVTYVFTSSCSAALGCTSIVKPGQTYRLVALSDTGARTVLDRQSFPAAGVTGSAFVLQHVTVQSNIIEQLRGGVIVLELEADGTVIAAGAMNRVKTLAGTAASTVQLPQFLKK